MWSAGPGDDKERFLADLRALRDTAALGYDELAARTHYPSDILKEAENGPSLPGLPILAAYVRACGGDVPVWEERWRHLGYEARADPGLPVRPAGASPAAVAGARAGVSIGPPEAYDPERIRAALRGRSGQQDQAANRRAAGQDAFGGGQDSFPAAGQDSFRAAGQDSFPAAGQDSFPAAGQDSFPAAGQDGFPAAGQDSFPVAGQDAFPASIRHDPFSASWLQDSEQAPPAPAEEPVPVASLPAPAAPPPSAAPDPAHRTAPELQRRTAPDSRQGGSAPWENPAAPAAPRAAAPARVSPLKLLAVIVVAALIGSILVLLIR